MKNKTEKRKLITNKKAAEEKEEFLIDMERDIEILKCQVKTEKEKVRIED